MQDIIDGGCAIQSTVTGRNLLCYIIDKTSKIAFCENAIRLVLHIGRKKFTTIAMKCGTTKSKLHGVSGKCNNDININTLRDEIETFIKLLADE